MWEWFTTKPFVDAGEARFVRPPPAATDSHRALTHRRSAQSPPLGPPGSSPHTRHAPRPRPSGRSSRRSRRTSARSTRRRSARARMWSSSRRSSGIPRRTSRSVSFRLIGLPSVGLLTESRLSSHIGLAGNCRLSQRLYRDPQRGHPLDSRVCIHPSARSITHPLIIICSGHIAFSSKPGLSRVQKAASTYPRSSTRTSSSSFNLYSMQ